VLVRVCWQIGVTTIFFNGFAWITNIKNTAAGTMVEGGASFVIPPLIKQWLQETVELQTN
jgi:hypothetical protein